jgi:hypothetical protein
MAVFVVWGVVTLAVLILAIPGLRHRRRLRAWEGELATALGKADQSDLLPHRLL